MARPVKDIAASVRQRLLTLSREQEQDFQRVLVSYGLERLLYRLSISQHRDRYVLKGGMLVSLWTIDPGRLRRMSIFWFSAMMMNNAFWRILQRYWGKRHKTV